MAGTEEEGSGFRESSAAKGVDGEASSRPSALRKIVGIAFFAALVFLGAKTCSVESAEVRIAFVFEEGAQQARVRELDVQLVDSEDELIGKFHKNYSGRGPDAKWPLQVAAGTYRLRGRIRTDAGWQSFSKELELEDGAEKRIYLDRYLRSE